MTRANLWELIPELYRTADAKIAGAPLRALVDAMTRQVLALENELERFYDDQFIETAAEWATGYIGEVIGYRPLADLGDADVSARAEIANTIAFRRRKGTASMLEQLAADVTGWPAHVVEYFQLLTMTQYLNHVRPGATATTSLRRSTELETIGRVNGAFDTYSRVADVRRISAPSPGRHNIPNIGIFLFRVAPFRITESELVPAVAGSTDRFRFDPLGVDTPLFAAALADGGIQHISRERDVPMPIGRRWAALHPEGLYGPGGSIDLLGVPGVDIRFCDLSDVATGWAHQPLPAEVAIDPVLGRVWFGTPPTQPPLATFHHGAAVPVGARSLVVRGDAWPPPIAAVNGGGSIQAELDAAAAAGGTVRVDDCGRYEPRQTVRAQGPDVVVAAASESRPLFVGGLELDLSARSTITLEGLVVTGGAVFLDERSDEQPRTVVLRDCTLVPGQGRTATGPEHPERASLIILDPFASVRLERCIVGPIVAVEGAEITIVDSVVDASDATAVAICGRAVAAGPRVVATVADQVVGDGAVAAGDIRLVGSTVIGAIHATELDVSECILFAREPAVLPAPRPAPIMARRRQTGCVRYSWLPQGSRVARRFLCQPEGAAGQSAVQPVFTSLVFGDPGYAQLASATPREIREGAENGSEMGATRRLATPLREHNLRVRLDEYLRLGLEAGIFYAN